ncbi:hypothetical protein, partial [Blautia stercoris]|uniref:hypothetical protein n=1 Tax=Blautia stercoris TaxID=871664 RepID=UPI004028A6DC
SNKYSFFDFKRSAVLPVLSFNLLVSPFFSIRFILFYQLTKKEAKRMKLKFKEFRPFCLLLFFTKFKISL